MAKTSEAKRSLRLAVFLLGVGLAGAALAGGTKKLPRDFVLPASEGSPGAVTFRHEAHLDAKQPSCVACHPRLFRILEKGATAGGETLKHEAMEAGRHCGACHGKVTFGFESCDMCHH
jgi:c(7)-type cytochrome triheme protein